MLCIKNNDTDSSSKKWHVKLLPIILITNLSIGTGLSSSAQAADKYWACNTNWWDFDCWSATFGGGYDGNSQPLDGDDVYIFPTGSTDITVNYWNTVYPSATLNHLGINALGTGSLTLAQSKDNLFTLSETITNASVVQTGGNHAVTNSLLISNGSSSSASFSVSGSGTAMSAGGITIGNDGSGFLNVLSGGDVTSGSIVIANAPGSFGNLTIDGAGSTLLGATGNIYVGDDAIGDLDITNGGALTSNEGYLGTNSGGSGIATVDGANSSWSLNSNLFVGYGGNGELNILAGADVTSNTASLAESSTKDGTVLVDNATWTNNVSLTVGAHGTGNLTIQNNADVSIGYGTSFIGNAATAQGNVLVDGAGSSFSTIGAGTLIVGKNGTGELRIQNGANASISNLIVGGSTATPGTYSNKGTVIVDGVGSYLSLSNLSIGESSEGDLQILNGAIVQDGSSTDSFIGKGIGYSSTVTIEGAGSRWISNKDLYVGGSDTEGGGGGIIYIETGGQLSVTGTLKIWEGVNRDVNLNGGTLTIGALDSGGDLNFNSGILNIGTNLALDTGSPLGSVSLNSLKALNVNGSTTLSGFRTLTIDGGTFSTGSLVDNNGGFTFNSGTFNLTNDNLVIGSTGMFGGLALFGYGKTVNVTNTATIDTGAVLALNNGVFNAGVINNNGTIDLDGPLSSVGGGTLNNNNLLTGDGIVTATLNNTVSGEVSVQAGNTVNFTNTFNANNGLISLSEGTARFDQGLTNASTGVISGRGTLIASGGLTNQGSINLSGGNTDVYGNVSNESGSSIIVSGNSTSTFFDDVVHNGDEIRVSDGSTAVFFGAVSGAGAYTGTGLFSFEGDLNPGNSPGLVSIAGDMSLGANSHTLMEIGGLVHGTEYDAFEVAGDLLLAGELDVALYDLGAGSFAPAIGDSFDLFKAETINGSFDILTFAGLIGGMEWGMEILADAYGSTDVLRLTAQASAVPLPAAAWMFLSGLGLLGVARYRRAS